MASESCIMRAWRYCYSSGDRRRSALHHSCNALSPRVRRRRIWRNDVPTLRRPSRYMGGAVDRRAPCAIRARYVTGIEHADHFFPRIEVEMRRRSAQPATLPLVIGGWIWDRVATLAEAGQRVWHILDFWHACDHLVKISRFLYGDGSDCCKECLQRWRGMLRNSRGAEVIEELPTLRDSGDSTLGDGFEGEIDYLTANQQRMVFRHYRELVLQNWQRYGRERLQTHQPVVCRAQETERHDVDHAQSHRHAAVVVMVLLAGALVAGCSLYACVEGKGRSRRIVAGGAGSPAAGAARRGVVVIVGLTTDGAGGTGDREGRSQTEPRAAPRRMAAKRRRGGGLAGGHSGAGAGTRRVP